MKLERAPTLSCTQFFWWRWKILRIKRQVEEYTNIYKYNTRQHKTHTTLSLLSLSRVPSLKLKVLNFLLLFTNLVALGTEPRKRDHQGGRGKRRKKKKGGERDRCCTKIEKLSEKKEKIYK